MTTRTMATDGAALPITWLLGTAAGWSLVPLVLFQQTMRTYLEVVQALPVYLLLGLVVGALTGLGQRLMWPGASARRWLWATVLGYGLALPAGLIIGVLIPSIV